MARWLPIESNPEVMNKFLHEAGLSKEWAIADVFGLDPGLAFSSIADRVRLLEAHVPTSKMCLLLQFNHKSTADLLQIDFCDDL